MGSESRFSQVSRRAFLQGLSAAAVLGAAGCSRNDTSVLPTSNPPTTSSAGTGTPPATSPAGAAAGELTVQFTYTVDSSASSGASPGGGGMARNPYIAVWIEDSSEDLVKTISLWHLQNAPDRWLSELHDWYEASDGQVTVSSATRPAGSYSLVWDLTDSSGARVPNGEYTLCIESSREHGPYSLVTADFQLANQPINAKLDPQGELTGGSLSYTP